MKFIKTILKIFKPTKSVNSKLHLDIQSPVTFNQVFFLYNLYQWVLVKPQASYDKMEINSLIAINYFNLNKKHHFPDNSFSDFRNTNGIPISEYVNQLYEVNQKEKLITEKDLVFSLTESGKRIVEIIKLGNYYEYDFFDKSIEYFTQDLINSLNENFTKLKNLSDNTLISTSLILIQ